MATPGWHPDPFHRHQLRWFDGTQWTAQVSDNGTTATDPMGVAVGPMTAPGGAPAGTSNKGPWVAVGIIGGLVALVIVAAGAILILSGDDGTSGPLTAEIEGLQTLVDGTDPDEDEYELLGDECVVDFEDLLDEAGADVPARAGDEEAAVYNAVDFDDPFYDCFVSIDDGGFALDAVEWDEDDTVDDLFDLLNESADDAERLDDGVHGGDIIEACHDNSVTDDDGEEVDDPFCEYYWSYDGSGLVIIVGANESLDMDGRDTLDVVVPPFREALRDAAG